MVVQPGNWSIFGLLDNIWSFGGADSEDINLLNFQYQAVYLYPDDWFLITNWTVSADWEEPSSERWTVPIGGGFGKAFKMGDEQYQVYGQVDYNVVKPDTVSTTWRFIFALTRVF